MLSLFRQKALAQKSRKTFTPFALSTGLANEMGALSLGSVVESPPLKLQETRTYEFALTGAPGLSLEQLRPFLRRQPTLAEVRTFWHQSIDPQTHPRPLAELFALLLIFCHKRAWTPPKRFGLEIEIPPAASYPTLAVPFVQSLAELAGRQLLTTEPAYLPHLCRREIFGEIRGWDDCLTAQSGQPGQILPLLTRPDRLFPTIDLPTGTSFTFQPTEDPANFDRHNTFRFLRDAAFLGKLALEEEVGRRWHHGTDISELEMGYYPENRKEITPDPALLKVWREHLERENCHPTEGTTYPAHQALSLVLAEHRQAESLHQILQEGTDDDQIEALATTLQTTSSRFAHLFPNHSPTKKALTKIRKALPPDHQILATTPTPLTNPPAIIALLHH
ncbi:MAG: hypothetical protein LAT58_11845 [Opitutales bacterium]|nr:hypothetical protein [Opitutales bacterium]